jgi:hypothetical protein
MQAVSDGGPVTVTDSQKEIFAAKNPTQRCGTGKRCVGLAPGSSGQSVYGSDYKIRKNKVRDASTNNFRPDFPFNV